MTMTSIGIEVLRKLGWICLLAAAAGSQLVVHGLAATPAMAYPSGIHRAKEVSLGVSTGLRRVDLNVAGVTGVSAVRATIPLRFIEVLATGGLGLPGRGDESLLDLSGSVGGAFLRGPWEEEGAHAETGPALVGSILVRGTLWSTSVFESGLYAEVKYMPSVAYGQPFVVGNLGLPGRVEVKNLFSAETGTGFTFWLRAGSDVFVVPYVKFYLSPVVASRVMVQQESMQPLELKSVTSGQDRLIGIAAGLGLAFKHVIVTPEVRGLPLSGGVSAIFPFGR